MQIGDITGDSSGNPVDSTHNCTGTIIFFSQAMQIAVIRLALTSPVSGFIDISLEMLFVANLVSHVTLQNSANLGRNAPSSIEGMQVRRNLLIQLE